MFASLIVPPVFSNTPYLLRPANPLDILVPTTLPSLENLPHLVILPLPWACFGANSPWCNYIFLNHEHENSQYTYLPSVTDWLNCKLSHHFPTQKFHLLRLIDHSNTWQWHNFFGYYQIYSCTQSK